MAHETAKDEASQENADQGGGHAKDAQQKVANGQIEQEDVSHWTHWTVQGERDDHQQIAHYG